MSILTWDRWKEIRKKLFAEIEPRLRQQMLELGQALQEIDGDDEAARRAGRNLFVERQSAAVNELKEAILSLYEPSEGSCPVEEAQEEQEKFCQAIIDALAREKKVWPLINAFLPDHLKLATPGQTATTTSEPGTSPSNPSLPAVTDGASET